MKKIVAAAALLCAVCLPLCGCHAIDDSSDAAQDALVKPANKLSAGTVYEDRPYGFQLDAPAPGEEVVVLHTSEGDIRLRLFPEAAPKAVENFVTHIKNGYYDGLLFHRVQQNFMIQGGDPLGTGAGGESIWGGAFEDEFDSKLLNLRGALSMANSGVNSNKSQFFINQAPASAFPGRDYYAKKTAAMLENFNQYVTQYRVQYDQLIAQYAQYGQQALIEQVYPTFEKYFWAKYQLAPNTNVVPDEVWDLYAQYGGNIHLDGAFRPKGGHTVFGQVFEGMDIVDAIAAKEVDANRKPLEDVTIVKAEVVTYQPS